MSIDITTPFNFLKTMKLSDYEHVDDFFLDFNEQLDFYAIEKQKELSRLKEENEMMREGLEYYADMKNWKYINGYRYTEIMRDDREILNDNGVQYIGGKKAREILKKIDENKISQH